MDMSGLFPVVAVTILLLTWRMFAGPVRHVRPAPRSEAPVRRSQRRLTLNPTLAALWILFLACIAILWTQDPPYASAFLITALSSCKLRRVWYERYVRPAIA